MKIRSLHLEHYRCFEDFEVSFDSQLTVLIGNNGAGKTAVLDALSIFLWSTMHPDNLLKGSTSIPIRDIAIDSNPEDIVLRLEVLSNSDIDMYNNVALIELAFNATHQDHVFLSLIEESIKAADAILDKVNPLSVSYMARRSISENYKISNSRSSLKNPAFENSFKRNIDYSSTLNWFNHADADEARAMRDGGQKGESPELKAVRYALSKALLGHYERPRMIGSPPELIIYRKDTDTYFKVSQLSDGYRVMLALVMDLARRMVQSNPGDCSKSAEQLLSVPAIVLIDEVELHLHPYWQKTVLTTLMEIFPSTQFIVTTHSPQVLTSISSEHIRILKDGKAYRVDEQTEGAESSRVLENILGVDLRPQKLDIVQTLEEYKALVYAEKWDTPEAMKKREKLAMHYGSDEPELDRLDLHIENIKWERGL